jgi:class 3 adenylate cyclase/tetratricopeptide (TPR) repeat protein
MQWHARGAGARRYRQAMAQVCARCGESAGDDARFCPSCGAPLSGLEGAERKLATIVFADLVGSTELASTLDPEELRRRLAPFFEAARSALEEHGGTVEKYVGDAVMSVFGVPQAHTDDPDRAAAAALQLVDRVAALDQGLAVRVGVETGPVLALDRGGDLSVTGEAVNAAARLQQAAGPGEVLVGDRSARACRAAKLEPAEPIEAKGFPSPLPAWRAVRIEAERRDGGTPFVGRDDDLALLELVYRRAARDRVPELVTVTGDAGVGKTRLATELTEVLRLADPAPQILLGRNPPYGRGIAFWALGEILRSAAGASADDSVGDVHSALAERLTELGAADADDLAAALGTALGGEAIDGDIEDELKRAWRRLVALLGSDRPLVIGIDDAQWADDGLLDLVEEVVFRLDDVPLLVLCTTRPELLERRPDFGRSARNVTQIELRPLTPEAADVLAAALLPAATRKLAPRVAEASGGNPFFVEEVACAVVEGRGVGGDRLPDTVQAAIAARLDLLPPVEKRTLQQAAVLGQNFLEPALEELSGEPPDDALRSLMEKALVQERLAIGPGRYGFRHHLIRDVAYASLPKAERARLHERAAEGIVGRAGEHYPELAELVAYHRVQAAELDPSPERTEAARRASIEAAEIAARRGATARAQQLFEQASALTADNRQRAEALRSAAELALQRWRGDETLGLLREAATMSDQAGEARHAASAYARLVEVSARMGGVSGALPEDELEELLRRGRALVPDDDTVTRARLLLDEAWIAWRFGRADQMAEPARAALELSRQTDDVPLLSSALDAVTALAWMESRYGDSIESVRERLELLAGTAVGGHLGVERSDALHMMVESLVAAGEYREAARYATQARELDLTVGTVYSGWGRGLLPAFFLGDWDNALHMAHAVREAWAAADRPPIHVLAEALACAGAILGYRGEESASGDWFRFTESVCPKPNGQVLRGAPETAVSGVRLLQADVDLHHGREAEAAERLAKPSTKDMWWRTPYAATRAEALVRAGDPRASEVVAEAEASIGDHAYGRGIVLRARGLADGDEGRLREALSVFTELECPYQAARTGWLLGGEDRAAAKRTFEGLGATLPAA